MGTVGDGKPERELPALPGEQNSFSTKLG